MPTSNVSEFNRQHTLLKTAMEVFLQFGFKKTSMDLVAKSAGVSRQGIYLHFANKEQLFYAAVQYTLEQTLTSITEFLNNAELNLEQQLIGTCNIWFGRYAGLWLSDSADLIIAAKNLVHDLFLEKKSIFINIMLNCIEDSALPKFYAGHGINSIQLIENLYATAQGLKYQQSHQDFLQGLTISVQILCSPMNSNQVSSNE